VRDGTGRWQRVVVAGATSEIVRAVLDRLDLAPGAEVVLAGRDLAAVSGVAAALPDSVRTRTVALDLDALRADPSAVCGSWFADGDVDLVIPAFGMLGDQRAAEADPRRAAEVLQLNLSDQVLLLLACARRMREQGHGTLVVLSSVAAVRPRRANFVYGASKAGLDAFARGLADSLHATGVHVLLVRPGFVIGRMTAGMQPAPLAVRPDEVGAAVAAALRSGQPLVWVPAPLRWLAVGLRLLPRRMWRRLER
jgi:decaprenylphospho-beta-D-erythro-pentofuranosid-2-ulose 2-reductase